MTAPLSRRAARAAIAIAPLALSACQTIDARPDQHRAQSIVQARTALDTPWTQPVPDDLWDGRSPLTADAAVRRALLTNPEIRASLEMIAESSAELVQSGLLPNPVLNLSLGFPIDGSGGYTSIGVSAMQQLAWILQRRPRTEAAAADLDARVLDASDRALRTAAQARALHARAVFAQRRVQERRAFVDQAGSAMALARRAAAAGEGTSLEVNRRDIRLIRQETLRARAEAELAAAKRRLLALMNLPDAPAEFELDDASPAAIPADLTEERIIALAAHQRLDTTAALARAEAARLRAGLARSDVWSGLEAGADYMRDDEGRDELGPALSVPIPIFDTGAARTAAAAAAARRAALDAAAVRNAAIAEARTLYTEAAAARDILAGRARDVVGLADRNLELSRRGFAAGTLDLMGLLEMEADAIEARIDLLDLEEAAALSAIELTRAVGGRLEAPPEPGPEPNPE